MHPSLCCGSGLSFYCSFGLWPREERIVPNMVCYAIALRALRREGAQSSALNARNFDEMSVYDKVERQGKTSQQKAYCWR